MGAQKMAEGWRDAGNAGLEGWATTTATLTSEQSIRDGSCADCGSTREHQADPQPRTKGTGSARPLDGSIVQEGNSMVEAGAIASSHGANTDENNQVCRRRR